MIVPTIAELERMVEEAKANPKRRKAKKTGGSRRHNSHRTNYAAQAHACHMATLELVERHNGKQADDPANDIPFQGEPVEPPERIGESGL